MIHIVVSQKIHRHIFLSEMQDKENRGNEQIIYACQKNDARWDNKLMIFLQCLKASSNSKEGSICL